MITKTQNLLEKSVSIVIRGEPRMVVVGQKWVVIATQSEMIVKDLMGQQVFCNDLQGLVEDMKIQRQDIFVLYQGGRLVHYIIEDHAVQEHQVKTGVDSIQVVNRLTAILANGSIQYDGKEISLPTAEEFMLHKVRIQHSNREILTLESDTRLLIYHDQKLFACFVPQQALSPSSYHYFARTTQGNIVQIMYYSIPDHLVSSHLVPKHLTTLAQINIEQCSEVALMIPKMFLSNGVLDPEVWNTMKLIGISFQQGDDGCRAFQLLFYHHRYCISQLLDYSQPSSSQALSRFAYYVEKILGEASQSQNVGQLEHFMLQLLDCYRKLSLKNRQVEEALKITLSNVRQHTKRHPNIILTPNLSGSDSTQLPLLQVMGTFLRYPLLRQQDYANWVRTCIDLNRPLHSLILVYSGKIDWYANLNLVLEVHFLCGKLGTFINFAAFRVYGIQHQRQIEQTILRFIEFCREQGDYAALTNLKIDQTNIRIMKPVLQKLVI